MKLSDQAVKQLEASKAIVSVNDDRTRIVYTDEFKKDFVERYRRGEKPVAIFRSYGLEPHLIGYKRIERCTARWVEQVTGMKASAIGK
ncbi:HTH domain-containing protein [Bifidobacterium sp. SO1]|uniref:HTH domain-containing protein n=1 Tax=Bifidobacterium sp. SO1 TaxID=2809029 RepID=UPI001BDD6626|nr:HTH domain-containing protein [Bifidobacterium sp. SO1]MBT1162159.1 hypothetical protein [Bifidobacterium sp. SO1]